jgi:hypothetical protein
MNILIEGLNNYKDFEEEYKPGRKLKRYITTKTDLIEQVTDVTMKLCWDEDDGEISKEWKFPMRFFFRHEIEHLIALSSLQLVTIYGDHKENRLSKESTDFVLVCEKRKMG